MDAMKLTDALHAAQVGWRIRRMPTHDNPTPMVLKLQAATVPILMNGFLVDQPGTPWVYVRDSWMFCKYVVIHEMNGKDVVHGAPYAFDDEEMAATDWEVVE